MAAELENVKKRVLSAGQVATQPWLGLACLFSLIIALAFLFAPTVRVLHSQWLDDGLQTYTHGYLIVAICVWLLYRERTRFAYSIATPSVVGVVALAISSLLWLITYRAGIQTAHQIVFAGILALVVLAAFGWRAFFVASFALGYFFFAIRLWDVAIGPLQWATTSAVHFLLKVTGIPAYVDGNLVHLAAGTFEIADGCSGLHFIIVGLALALLYGEVNRDSIRTRLVLVSLALFLALLTNWVRVYTIVAAGYATDMQHYLVRVEHYRFGWLVFAVSMVTFFLIARRFPLRAERPFQYDMRDQQPIRTLAFGSLVALGAAAVGPVWNWLSPTHGPSPNIAESGRSQHGARVWEIRFAGADSTSVSLLETNLGDVEITTATYFYQSEDKELLGYGNTLTPSSAEQVATSARVDGPTPVIESRVTGTRDWLMWHYYEIGGVKTNRAWRAQLLYGYKSLLGSPVSRVVALRAECRNSCDAARDSLQLALASLNNTGMTSRPAEHSRAAEGNLTERPAR